jgi:ribosomal protein S18 acetylase RimI-like enzyme
MLFEWPSALSEKDMQDLIDLMNTVAVKETTLGFFEPLSSEVGMSMMESLNADLKKEACHLLIARDASQRIVGMIILAQQTLPARRHIVEMRRCVIEPKYRGQFILDGWRLALDKVQEMKCDIIILDVRSDGKAERLWRMLGFKEYGRMDDYARVRGRIITGFYLRAYLEEILAYKKTYGTYWHRLEESTDAELQVEH